MRSLQYNQAIAVVRDQQMVNGMVLCPFCIMNGIRLIREATDPHHWLIKQGANVDESIQNDPINIILLCKEHHGPEAHTPTGRLLAYRWKSRLYDIEAWIERLERDGYLRHHVELPQPREKAELLTMLNRLKRVQTPIPLRRQKIEQAIEILNWVVNRTSNFPIPEVIDDI